MVKESSSYQRISEALAEAPIIAAVRDREGLEAAVAAPVTVVFILAADLGNLAERVAFCRAGGKLPLVHLDMVAGLSKDQAALAYLSDVVKPAGVITTKPALIKPAREAGLAAVERIFLLDSLSVQTGTRLALAHHPDFVEVMPGTMPEVIESMRRQIALPLIAGGMITTKEQVIKLFGAGVTAVSTSRPELWSA